MIEVLFRFTIFTTAAALIADWLGLGADGFVAAMVAVLLFEQLYDKKERK